MHSFSELISRCTSFTLSTLEIANDKTLEALQTSGAINLIKTLQMIRLQKAIMAVGMFSLLEAHLQDILNCDKGFVEVKKMLTDEKYKSLLEEFVDLELAINVLKHGRGRSYETLIAKDGGTLKPYMKLFDENPPEEGNVDDITTLIDVDENFINHCMEVIDKVSEAIKEVKPDLFHL